MLDEHQAYVKRYVNGKVRTKPKMSLLGLKNLRKRIQTQTLARVLRDIRVGVKHPRSSPNSAIKTIQNVVLAVLKNPVLC